MARVVGRVASKGPEPRYRPIEGELEARQLVEQAEMIRAAVDIQFPSKSLRFRGKVLEPSTSSEGFTLELPDDLDLETCEAIAAGPVDQECMLIVFLRGLMLLGVRSTSASIENGRLKVRGPLRLFGIQRRKEGRFDIPSGYDLSARMDAIDRRGVRVDKRILDLSASGIGFQVVSPREAGLFKPGVLLKNIQFQIQNRMIGVDLEVCNLVPIPKERLYAGTKIGCKFTRISPDDAEFLSSWVTARLVSF